MDKGMDRGDDGIVSPAARTHKGTAIRAGIVLPALIFISLSFILPLVFTSIYIIFPSSGKMAMLKEIQTNPYYWRITGFTFFQAGLSTIIAVLLGLPGGILLGRTSFRGKGIIHAFTAIPFVLPSIIVVLGFVLVYGNSGALNSGLSELFNLEKGPLRILYTKWAIILAHAFYNFPLTIRYVSSFISGMSRDQEEAAALLGAGKAKQFFTITLPRILPVILSAASIIFIFCFLSFALILVLGGGPRTTTLEVEVYRLARVHVDFAGAAVLGTASTLFTMIVTWIYIRLQRLTAMEEETVKTEEQEPRQQLKGVLSRGYLAAIAVFALAPLIAVFVQSFLLRRGYTRGITVGLGAWMKLFLGENRMLSITAVSNSLLVAAGVSVLASVLGLSLSHAIRHSRIKKTDLMETLMMMPLGISSILLTLGYLTVKSVFNIPRQYNVLLILAAHSIIAYPFVLRSLVTAYRKIPQSVFDAASQLGAGPGKRFLTIELPLLRNALTAAAVFAFAVSMGEINAVLMLSEGRFTTIPLAVYRLIGSYDFTGACVLGVILILSGMAAFYTIDTIGGTRGT